MSAADDDDADDDKNDGTDELSVARDGEELLALTTDDNIVNCPVDSLDNRDDKCDDDDKSDDNISAAAAAADDDDDDDASKDDDDVDSEEVFVKFVVGGRSKKPSGDRHSDEKMSDVPKSVDTELHQQEAHHATSASRSQWFPLML